MTRAVRGALLAVIAGVSLSAPPAVQFEDVARAAGIHFVHHKGGHAISTILEEAGPGVCVADYDGDGFQDIYFVNGRNPDGENALYHNNGDGTFTDVTEKAGVPGNAYGLGCVWGDYDNDGHPDLYVTQYGKNILYHNNGDGTFADVTAKARVDGADFGTVFHSGATFFDYDRDGYLDLYAGGYVEFSPQSKQSCIIGYGIQASCPPSEYKGTPAVLYHNNRDGTFTNVTKAAGIFQPNGKNLSVQAIDYDNDGWPDLFVANDGLEVYLYHNEHNGTFKEVALTTGVARSANGNTMAAICLSFGDYDNDGLLDLYISDWQGSGDHIWHNDGDGFLEEVTELTGIAATSRVLSFGGGFFDYDNDGRLDLFKSRTAMSTRAWKRRRRRFTTDRSIRCSTTRATASLWKSPRPPAVDSQRRTWVAAQRSPIFATTARSTSWSAITAIRRCCCATGAARATTFVNIRLAGTKSNRDAMGARVKLTAGGVVQIREIAGGGSYLSQSDLRAHFGLGSSTRVASVEISWPSGIKQTFRDLEADHFYLVEEGKDPRNLSHLSVQGQ